MLGPDIKFRLLIRGSEPNGATGGSMLEAKLKAGAVAAVGELFKTIRGLIGFVQGEERLV